MRGIAVSDMRAKSRYRKRLHLHVTMKTKIYNKIGELNINI